MRDTGDDTAALAQLQPLFTQYKVPLVIQAHMHGYERFETPGLTLVTAGGGGGAIGDVNANTTRTYCNQRVASGAYFHAVMFEITPGSLPARSSTTRATRATASSTPCPEVGRALSAARRRGCGSGR